MARGETGRPGCFQRFGSASLSYEFKNRLDETSTRDEWLAVLRGAYESQNAFMTQRERRVAGQYPTFPERDAAPRFLVVKDTRFHNLTERALQLLPELKVISIVRHPCGAIHSWLTAPREFPSCADPLSEWRSGSVRKTGYGEFWGFDDWKRVTSQHIRLESRYPHRATIVRYENLVVNPLDETERLFGFAGLQMNEQTRRFLTASHSSHIDSEYAVFKRADVKDRWRQQLHPAIRDTILAELANSEFQRFLS